MGTIRLKGTGNSFTPVPDTFILTLLDSVGEKELKMILVLLLCHKKGDAPTLERLSEITGMTEIQIIDACENLSFQGIIQIEKQKIDGSMTISLETSALLGTEGSQSSVEDIHISNEYTSGDAPTGNRIPTQEESQKELKDLYDFTERISGKPLGPALMTVIRDLKEVYGLNKELSAYLISYCNEQNALDRPYIEKVASSWKDEGLETAEDADIFLEKGRAQYKKYRTILKYMGLNTKNISDYHRKSLDRWFVNYGFSEEMVMLAADYTLNYLNRADFKYMEGILSRWKTEGLDTREKVESSRNVTVKSGSRGKERSGFTSYTQRSDEETEETTKKLLSGWFELDE